MTPQRTSSKLGVKLSCGGEARLLEASRERSWVQPLPREPVPAVVPELASLGPHVCRTFPRRFGIDPVELVRTCWHKIAAEIEKSLFF